MLAESVKLNYVESESYRELSELLRTLNYFNLGLEAFMKKRTQLDHREKAILAIAANSISIIFSINLLLRNGFLVSSKVLLRPLVERIATLAAVSNKAEHLNSWYKGWGANHRPKDKEGRRTLEALLAELNDFKLISGETRSIGEVLSKDFSKVMNFEVHGSYNSAELNMSEDRSAYASGPNDRNLPEFNTICRVLKVLIAQLQFEVHKALPILLSGTTK
jgi:hypothetical protein